MIDSWASSIHDEHPFALAVIVIGDQLTYLNVAFLHWQLEVFCGPPLKNLHFGLLFRRISSKIGLMVALTICALSYNLNTQLSSSFALSINFPLVLTSRVCTCAHCTFFWLIPTVALAFVTNSTIIHKNRSKSAFSVFFYLFDSSSKTQTISSKTLCLNLVTNSNNYC